MPRTGGATCSSPRSPATARQRPSTADRAARGTASRRRARRRRRQTAQSGDRRPRAARPHGPRPASPAARPACADTRRLRKAGRAPPSRTRACRHRHASTAARQRPVAALRLAGADRDLPARLPEIELTERSRPIRRALKRARPRQKQRPHLTQVIVEDRLAARIALLLKHLAQPLARQPRIVTQQPVHLVAERIQLRRPRRPPIARRLARAQRAPDRVTAVAGAPDDLLDRQPLHEEEPSEGGIHAAPIS